MPAYNQGQEVKAIYHLGNLVQGNVNLGEFFTPFTYTMVAGNYAAWYGFWDGVTGTWTPADVFNQTFNFIMGNSNSYFSVYTQGVADSTFWKNITLVKPDNNNLVSLDKSHFSYSYSGGINLWTSNVGGTPTPSYGVSYKVLFYC